MSSRLSQLINGSKRFSDQSGKSRLQKIRENGDCKVSSSGLKRHKNEILHIMSADPELAKIVKKVQACSSHRRCKQYQCNFCGTPFAEQNQRVLKDHSEEPLSSDIYVDCHPTGNFRLDWGTRFHQFERANQDRNVFTATINIALLPFDANQNHVEFGNSLKNEANKFRLKLKNIIKNHDAQISYLGLFEDSIYDISNDNGHDIFDQSWKKKIGNAKYAIKLHIHMLVAGITKCEFKTLLEQNGLKASNQVRCSELQPVVLEHGIRKGGSLGWGQYSGKMFLDYKCVHADDKPDVIRFTELYRTVFTKHCRKCSFNNAPSKMTSVSKNIKSSSSRSLLHKGNHVALKDKLSYQHSFRRTATNILFFMTSFFQSYTSNNILYNIYYNRNSVRKYNSSIKRLEKKFVSSMEQVRSIFSPAQYVLKSRKRE